MLSKPFYKKILQCLALCCLLCYGAFPAKAQHFDVDSNQKRVTIPFRIVRNMVVIKLHINNKGAYNFILDTGVGLMLITDPKLADSIYIPNKRTLKIPGLGDGEDCEAFITTPLKIDIPGLKSYGESAAILKKDHFGLSNYAGIPIHGLLGYEFFSRLAVKVSFSDSTITVCRPKDLRPFRKANIIPITIEDHKPYLQAKITMPNGTKKNSKLIIDLGAGHPVSLENMVNSNGLPQKFVPANLGIGLNGPISGFIGRINEVELGKYKIKNVLASFPEDIDVQKRPVIQRDGNLGIGILKKFTVIFNYTNNVMYLKPGMHYNEPFEHDMSGLEYYATGPNYNHIIISRVEPGSAGADIGLEKNDEITSINFKPVANMRMEEIDELFKSKDDRSLLLEVFHDKVYSKVVLTLKRRI